MGRQKKGAGKRGKWFAEERADKKGKWFAGREERIRRENDLRRKRERRSGKRFFGGKIMRKGGKRFFGKKFYSVINRGGCP